MMAYAYSTYKRILSNISAVMLRAESRESRESREQREIFSKRSKDILER